MSESSERKFNEDEIGRLLQLAIKRQEEVKENQPSPDQGLTLEEVERIAQEVGIDPKHLQYALAHLNDLPEKASKFYFWGAPTVLQSEVEVTGHLTEESMVDMLALIRENFKVSHGNFENLKNSFSWHNSAVTIEAKPTGDNTVINIKEKMEGPIIGSHVWWMLTIFLGTLIFFQKDTTLFTFSMTVGIASLFYVMGWFINSYLAKQKEGKIRDLLSKLQDISAAHNQPVTWSYTDSSSSKTHTPMLDLDKSDGYDTGNRNQESIKKTKSS